MKIIKIMIIIQQSQLSWNINCYQYWSFPNRPSLSANNPKKNLWLMKMFLQNGYIYIHIYVYIYLYTCTYIYIQFSCFCWICLPFSQFPTLHLSNWPFIRPIPKTCLCCDATVVGQTWDFKKNHRLSRGLNSKHTVTPPPGHALNPQQQAPRSRFWLLYWMVFDP